VKSTKILATYGPAIATSTGLKKLIAQGVNLFRVNCSHGATEDFLKAAAVIREAASDARFPIGLLFDISGPKLRVERFQGKIDLAAGTELVLTVGESDPERGLLAVNHPAVINSLRVGDRVCMDDGQLMFDVIAEDNATVTLKSLTPGVLTGGKGINLPGVSLDIPTITEKDRVDIRTAVEVGADYIALSFVRSPDDIDEARALIVKCGGKQRLIAKLEKREAIDRLDDVMNRADGVMIARGDLGVELPPEELPILQKKIIRLSIRHRKPVIVATQMLESMRFAPRPTRAEVNDVATAVLDGVDAVMLSAETATGAYPVETVRMMSKVIVATERSLTLAPAAPVRSGAAPIPQAIADAVSHAMADSPAKIVFAFTVSGYTAELISSLLPPHPIIALTPDPRVMAALSLYRSVYPVLAPEPVSFDDMLATVSHSALEYELVASGQAVMVTGGAPFGSGVGTNFMMITTIKEEQGKGPR